MALAKSQASLISNSVLQFALGAALVVTGAVGIIGRASAEPLQGGVQQNVSPSPPESPSTPAQPAPDLRKKFCRETGVGLTVALIGTITPTRTH